MSVSLDKPDATTYAAGTGMNSGSGPLRMIAGRPVAREFRAVIRLTGAGVRGVRITEDPHITGLTAAVLVGTDGGAQVYRTTMRPADVRDKWLRYAVENGIYAGVDRMS
jgi:hypothetical protein